jgi:hypothetical protein
MLVAATVIAYRRSIVGMGARGDPAWIAAVAFQGKHMVASLARVARSRERGDTMP